ncbi:MAG: energy transducer TonB [Zoogloeaceae bacterium]|jgi:protein TonB|nr:energy transducer TonB [Zoogloeaceae bacterium]
MRNALPGQRSGLFWFVLALLLHAALFFSAHFWPGQEKVSAHVEEAIQVSLMALSATESSAPPAASPPPATPRAPQTSAVPRPSRPAPQTPPETQTPVPLREAPAEMPAAPAVSAPAASGDASGDAASESASAAAADGSSTANASAGGLGASRTEARFDAAYLKNPKPPYPATSRRLREEGTVHLRVRVLPSGEADQVEIQRSSGFSRLDDSAYKTVLAWRFVPGRQGGEAIISWVVVPIRFNLKESFP